mgnify:CR=1 FL=1
MLVNATEMLLKARDGHYGVPQFNINNLEWTQGRILTACEEIEEPRHCWAFPRVLVST